MIKINNNNFNFSSLGKIKLIFIRFYPILNGKKRSYFQVILFNVNIHNLKDLLNDNKNLNQVCFGEVRIIGYFSEA